MPGPEKRKPKVRGRGEREGEGVVVPVLKYLPRCYSWREVASFVRIQGLNPGSAGGSYRETTPLAIREV